MAGFFLSYSPLRLEYHIVHLVYRFRLLDCLQLFPPAYYMQHEYEWCRLLPEPIMWFGCAIHLRLY